MNIGQLLSLLALLLFAANTIVVRLASERHVQRSGFMIALCANAVGVVVVLASTVLVGHTVTWDWRGVAVFALVGLLTTFLGRRLLFLAIQEIGPSRASALQVTNPIFALVIGVTFLGDEVTTVQLLCIVAVLAGLYLTSREARPLLVAPVVPDAAPTTMPTAVSTRTKETLSSGVAIALFAAVSYGVGNVLRAAGVRSWEEPVLGTLVGVVAAMALYGAVVMRPRELWTSLIRGERRGVALWITSGLLTAVAQVCVTAASGLIPVAVVLVISSSFPIVILPVSVLLLHNAEGVTTSTFAGAVVIVAGVSTLVLQG